VNQKLEDINKSITKNTNLHNDFLKELGLNSI
jgi:hypothetical protein